MTDKRSEETEGYLELPINFFLETPSDYYRFFMSFAIYPPPSHGGVLHNYSQAVGYFVNNSVDYLSCEDL